MSFVFSVLISSPILFENDDGTQEYYQINGEEEEEEKNQTVPIVNRFEELN